MPSAFPCDSGSPRSTLPDARRTPPGRATAHGQPHRRSLVGAGGRSAHKPSLGNWPCCPPPPAADMIMGDSPPESQGACPASRTQRNEHQSEPLGSGRKFRGDPQGVSVVTFGPWMHFLYMLSQSGLSAPQWKGNVLKFVFLYICVSKEGCLGSLWGSNSNKIGILGRNNNKTGL